MDIRINPKYLKSQDPDRAKRDLAVIYEVSNAMRSTLKLERILHIILTSVTSHRGLGFNRAILFQVNNASRMLEPTLAIGPDSLENAKEIWDYIKDVDPELDELANDGNLLQSPVKENSFLKSIEHIKIPLEPNSDYLLADAYHLGNPMHVTKQKLENYCEDTLLKELKTDEIVIIPLKAKDKVNGLIVADNIYTQKPITKEDMRLFMMLANQAGLAIENSHLYEMVMHQSHTDALTGLWNHGYFQNQLDYQFTQAFQQSSPLSLLLIDIDNFKKLNDTLGHQYGDTILKTVARILKESSRETDFVCRYGGEEFAIILPHTTLKQGQLFAERVRERVEDFPFSHISPETPDPVTISVGLSTIPGTAQSKTSLVELADKALYVSKNNGKNLVTIAQNS